MSQVKRYLVTAALPYANGPLHIGHLAGAYLTSDIYSRFLRMMGEDVVFICGSDEHGAAITIRAKKEGISPQEIVDKYHTSFKDTFEKLGISFDFYHRTSSDLHKETAQDFFRHLDAKGHFIKKTTEQYYDAEANQFLADRYITGTCPKCNHEEAYGDQCENCGSALSPTELIHPKSTLSGNVPVLKNTTHWFLPLDKDETWLREWTEKGTLDGAEHHNPSEWKNHVLGQCKSWIDGGLMPRAMTRDLEWGVRVPEEIEGSEGKRLYVWMDAPIGYISATKAWAEANGKDWQPYWKSNDTKLVHFVGKDNIVFHCIIFPSLLKAHGDYQLPDNVPANQFLNLEGKKLSTSRNWAVWAHEYVEECKEEIANHIDVMRYHLIRIFPEQRDSEFTWQGFQDSNNNELVNALANFVNRVVVLTNKYYDGVIPKGGTLDAISSGDQSQEVSAAVELKSIYEKVAQVQEAVLKYDFRGGMKKVMEIASAGNQFLQFNEPWKVVKTNPELVENVMNLAIQYVAVLGNILAPFLPNTSTSIKELLGFEGAANFPSYSDMITQLAAGEACVPSGKKINKPVHLFSRIPDAFVTAQIEKLAQSVADAPVEFEAIKEETTFDDFSKIDLRSGTIITAAKMKGAKKLLQLEVDLGFEKRTILSGIAEFFDPEKIIGQQVVVVANLAPRKMRGVMSEGMILMAENEKGELGFVGPSEGFGNGFVVK